MKLDDLVVSYGEHDSELKELTKTCDALKTNLKDTMKELGEDSHSYGGYTVTRSVSNRETFNEEKALNLLKSKWFELNGSMVCPFVKTVEVLDMEALESALYNGEIDNEIILELDKCRTSKEVVTLKCTKSKKGQ